MCSGLPITSARRFAPLTPLGPVQFLKLTKFALAIFFVERLAIAKRGEESNGHRIIVAAALKLL